MDEAAESPPASSSPLSSVSSTQTWLPAVSPVRPPWMNGCKVDPGNPHMGTHSSPPFPFYEELFCTSQRSSTLAPLAGALVTSSGPRSDVAKQGYLGKAERNQRKYFVLRAGSHTGPSRLEWYRNKERFSAMEKSAGKAGLFGSSKQGVIYLRCCLGVSRTGSTRKGHTVALYAKDQTMVLAVEDQWEQEEWYLAIKKLMEEERRDEEHGEGFDEEDDGYCTLPPAAFFKEVWPVTVKPRDLGCSKSLAGESRLCLTASSLVLVRVGVCSDLPSVTIPLLSVRRFGHLDGSFFLELGRSAPNGPGEIWMEARDQGNPAVAQHIHEVVRDTVRALRALPDFSRSPTSNPNQPPILLASKRCRPKYRDKVVNVRPLGSRLVPPPRNSESPTQCYPESRKPDPESTLSPVRSYQSSTSETSSYMEMKTDHHLPVNKQRENDCWMKVWEPGGEEEEGKEEGRGYMMMSPQVSSSSVLPQNDYVTMASPSKHDWPVFSSPQTSFNSSTSDSYSPQHLSHHEADECSQPHCQSQTETDQSQMTISCSAQPQDDAVQQQNSSEQRRLPAPSSTTLSPVSSVDVLMGTAPFVPCGPGYTRPVQASPDSGSGRPGRLQAVSTRSVRRHRLSLCLPCCLQTEDR
ncbi:uncharacterized protein LOC115576732 isoform X2 [Sparus aurata]|uniref:uncharacterized protein LOC115576732 isoform X2 n=1 Tax=Sparus aurata TaxID=8175 RepID=UPI0011C12A6D|nr:uncharacterized protein LOC115576732 isoform X2 [Sparus aurata]